MPDSAEDPQDVSARQPALGCVPLASYGVAVDTIAGWVRQGQALLKIKIGADPGQDGDPQKMLEWDCRRLEAIHRAVGNMETSDTATGHPAYYLDANARYDGLDRLRRFLDHAEKIGARDRILMIEEPFPEDSALHVGGLGVPIAADESAHSAEHVRERLQLGYGMVALKPIAKTLSMSLAMLAAAAAKGAPCFCADLTVNPILVEWNKLLAGHLPLLPGMHVGIVETNGEANYRDWDRLRGYHPCVGRSWTAPVGGRFTLSEDFYGAAGGILEPSAHYLRAVQN